MSEKEIVMPSAPRTDHLQAGISEAPPVATENRNMDLDPDPDLNLTIDLTHGHLQRKNVSWHPDVIDNENRRKSKKERKAIVLGWKEMGIATNMEADDVENSL
jgi:hypothetical protein